MRCAHAALGCALTLSGAGVGSLRPALASAQASAEPRPRPSAELEPTSPTLALSGLIQVDAGLWNRASVDELDPSTGTPLNEERFVLRRARLRADVTHGVLRANLILDGNTVDGPTLRVLGAELGAGLPPAPEDPMVFVGVGLFLIPFGFETVEPSADRLFFEPSQWVRALFPGRRDLGARAQAKWSFLRAQVAVVNGEPIGSARFALRDPSAAKDVVGRLGVDGELAQGVRVRAGSSLLLGTGLHPGKPQSKDSLVWRDANEDGIVQTTELQVIAGAPAEASEDFDRFALGGDVALDATLPLLGALRVYGELSWAKNADHAVSPADPVATGRDARELGLMLGVRQYLTRHVELGVRYDRYAPDLDATDAQGAEVVPIDASLSTWAFAVAWCTLPGARLTLQYERKHNALGRSAGGEPATLGSDVLQLRAQMVL